MAMLELQTSVGWRGEVEARDAADSAFAFYKLFWDNEVLVASLLLPSNSGVSAKLNAVQG